MINLLHHMWHNRNLFIREKFSYRWSKLNNSKICLPWSHKEHKDLMFLTSIALQIEYVWDDDMLGESKQCNVIVFLWSIKTIWRWVDSIPHTYFNVWSIINNTSTLCHTADRFNIRFLIFVNVVSQICCSKKS